MSHPIIALWSPPRSISTAFLRIFKERRDFTVFNEAFCDLATIGKYPCAHDGVEYQNDADVLALIKNHSNTQSVFFKETCEASFAHLFQYREFMESVVHTFLVRDPAATINSHYAMNNDVTSDEIGYQNLLEVLNFVQHDLKKTAIVLDAKDLIDSPAMLNQRYCELAGIPFHEEALNWQPGDIPEWSRTKAWHKDVSQSAGIHPNQRQYEINVDNNQRLQSYYNRHKPIYDEIVKHKILLEEGVTI